MHDSVSPPRSPFALVVANPPLPVLLLQARAKGDSAMQPLARMGASGGLEGEEAALAGAQSGELDLDVGQA